MEILAYIKIGNAVTNSKGAPNGAKIYIDFLKILSLSPASGKGKSFNLTQVLRLEAPFKDLQSSGAHATS